MAGLNLLGGPICDDYLQLADCNVVKNSSALMVIEDCTTFMLS